MDTSRPRACPVPARKTTTPHHPERHDHEQHNNGTSERDMTPQRLPHGDGQAVRTPDGTYMHIAPNTDADTLATALATRAESRRPHHPT
ncbi:hypothetical protein, partial [Dermatophilus congolensis]